VVSTVLEKTKNGRFVLIAEIGVNYYDIAYKKNISLMEAAKDMIDEAKKAGIDAVKFQTYKAEKLAVKSSPYYWNISEEPTRTQYELFKKYDSFNYNEYYELSKYCRNTNIEFLSTPFDCDAVDYLDELMDVFKISSSDINNLPFIEYIAKKNKPIILSAGASNESEIDMAIRTIRCFNNQSLIVMHCVLEYPTPYEHANLNKITTLRNRYKELIIGYSDHTKPDPYYDVIKTAYNLGAIIIEKHFTTDKKLAGNDHYHAMDANDARKILDAIKYLDSIRGNEDLICLDSEKIARKNARRSIVSFGKIPMGNFLKKENVVFKRPGTGISPDRIYEILDKKVKYDIEDDTILTFDMFIKT
jgi:N-acetylneuraminate synthase